MHGSLPARSRPAMTTLPRLALLAVIITAVGCGDGVLGAASRDTLGDTFGGSPTATSVDVTMPGGFFTPNRIDVARGGVVRFVFTAVVHDVRFNGAVGAPTDVLATSNTTVARTFNNTGTFAFLCTLHPNMEGSVVVH